jgi:hypothetical protein
MEKDWKVFNSQSLEAIKLKKSCHTSIIDALRDMCDHEAEAISFYQYEDCKVIENPIRETKWRQSLIGRLECVFRQGCDYITGFSFPHHFDRVYIVFGNSPIGKKIIKGETTERNGMYVFNFSEPFPRAICPFNKVTFEFIVTSEYPTFRVGTESRTLVRDSSTEHANYIFEPLVQYPPRKFHFREYIQIEKIPPVTIHSVLVCTYLRNKLTLSKYIWNNFIIEDGSVQTYLEDSELNDRKDEFINFYTKTIFEEI